MLLHECSSQYSPSPRALSLSLSVLIRTLMLHTGVESARHQTGEPLDTLLFQEEEYGATTLPENGEERAQNNSTLES